MSYRAAVRAIGRIAIERPTIALGDVFNDKDLTRAKSIYNHARVNGKHIDTGKLHDALRDEVVIPAMERINKATGQANDADYWAYVLEFALQGEKSHRKLVSL